MKVTVLVGSPRKGGNTEIMADEFIKGAEEVGHDVEKILLADKNIGGCKGCQYCFAHDGECVQKDDMTAILERLDETDCLVLASPIYWFNVTAQIKAVIDRLYARASKGYKISCAAMLLDSTSDGVYGAAEKMFEDLTNFLKWERKGVVKAPGMEKKNTMLESPKRKEAYDLGRNL